MKLENKFKGKNNMKKTILIIKIMILLIICGCTEIPDIKINNLSDLTQSERLFYEEKIDQINHNIQDEIIKETLNNIQTAEEKQLIKIEKIKIESNQSSLELFNNEIMAFENREISKIESKKSLLVDYPYTYILYKYMTKEQQGEEASCRIITLIVEINQEGSIVKPYHIYVYNRYFAFTYNGEGTIDETKFSSYYYKFGEGSISGE